MALMNEKIEGTERLVRIMAYGPAKSRKTTWALQAAELGYNVIMADFDHSYHVAQQLSPEAQRRIYHIDMRLPTMSVQNPLGYVLMKAASGETLWFNENTRQFTGVSKVAPELDYVRFDFDKFTSKDVLIIDSWTAFVQHLNAAQFAIMDATQVSKLEWDDIAKIRLALDLFLGNLTKCNAHVIIIGHAEQYAKRFKDAAAKAKPEDAIESIRTQPSSISRPHAETMARHFTDIINFSMPTSSYGVQLSTKGYDDLDAGSRVLPPFKGKIADYGFEHFVTKANLEAVKSNKNFSSEALVFSTGEEIAAARGKTSTAINVGEKPSILTRKKV